MATDKPLYFLHSIIARLVRKGLLGRPALDCLNSGGPAMSVGEPLSLGKPAAPSQQSLLALSWLNFFLAGMQTAFGPIAAAYLAAREWTATASLVW
jgi:hypothetical protein